MATEFERKYYKQLVGGKIVKAGVVDEDGYSWPYFEVEMPDGQKYAIEVSCDPEGNGPGFLFGLPAA